MYIKYSLLNVIPIIFSVTAYAGDNPESFLDGFVKSASFGKPFISETHSPLTKMETGYNKSYSEFDLLEQNVKFNRPIVELHLGLDAPLYGYDFYGTDDKPKWGLALSLPLSIHVLEDIIGPITAPVIDTDYRFGSPRIRAINYLDNNEFIENVSFSWLPMFHECTHLGDEITIFRINEKFPITRVNVSYEFTEFQLTVNDPNGTRKNNHAFRLGGIYRISNRGHGWFSVAKDDELTQDINIEHSKTRLEYYGQYQFQRSTGVLASERNINVLSFEARHRLRYGYPIFKRENGGWTTLEVKEQMQWAFNLYYGWQFHPATVASTESLGLFFHAYKGMNPYGQLRNYPGYPFFGFSLVYDR